MQDVRWRVLVKKMNGFFIFALNNLVQGITFSTLLKPTLKTSLKFFERTPEKITKKKKKKKKEKKLRKTRTSLSNVTGSSS